MRTRTVGFANSKFSIKQAKSYAFKSIDSSHRSFQAVIIPNKKNEDTKKKTKEEAVKNPKKHNFFKWFFVGLGTLMAFSFAYLTVSTRRVQKSFISKLLADSGISEEGEIKNWDKLKEKDSGNGINIGFIETNFRFSHELLPFIASSKNEINIQKRQKKHEKPEFYTQVIRDNAVKDFLIPLEWIENPDASEKDILLKDGIVAYGSACRLTKDKKIKIGFWNTLKLSLARLSVYRS